MTARHAQRFAPRQAARAKVAPGVSGVQVQPSRGPRAVARTRFQSFTRQAGLVAGSAALVLAACGFYALAWQWFVADLGFRPISLGHAFALFALVLGRDFPPMVLKRWEQGAALAGEWLGRYVMLFGAHWLVMLGG